MFGASTSLAILFLGTPELFDGAQHTLLGIWQSKEKDLLPPFKAPKKKGQTEKERRR